VRISAFSRYALTIWVAAALLAGCDGAQPPLGTPGAISQSPRDHSARSASSVVTGARKQQRWHLPGHTISPRKWHTVRDDHARRRLL
jgi:hypothetical protein